MLDAYTGALSWKHDTFARALFIYIRSYTTTAGVTYYEQARTRARERGRGSFPTILSPKKICVLFLSALLISVFDRSDSRSRQPKSPTNVAANKEKKVC